MDLAERVRNMQQKALHTVCWVPTWSRNGLGLEHFRATLPVDEEGFVTDYPELFRRVS
ncbi:putative glycolipid-binding domain-containing protein [Aquincola sp. S2]|uniref:Glycolipid-binding domain-containing protein n=1 Tax=Pseudaquabacterium terrae TaxID=2732868 RepID=A0ABX2EFT5_9BURK|nr:putative glycolipid-binding domain-containing protein [Aquabacterium terrae]NRF67479.1 putative glycolipid-binding domain-containing protein [Aquabacterium terrae]